MQRLWSVRSLAILACVVATSRGALAERAPDLCAPPKMQTEKWPTTEQVGGATVLLPPGFHSATAVGGASGERYFVNGHREIIVGPGSTPKSDALTTTSVEKLPAAQPAGMADNSPQMTQLSSCETTINGHHVEITLSSAMVHSNGAPDAGGSGSSYLLLARFYSAPPVGEMFIAFETDARSEISSYRQLFWAVTFDGSAPPSSAPAKPPAPGAIAAAPAPVPCTPKSDPSLPGPDAVLDTALVQSLLASAGPVPHGFALMSLKFDGKGALTNISVPQSDLPDPAQRQLATLVASNLKPHDKHTPSSYTLRVDAADTGLRYTVGGACGP
ncbi:MAG TPA: hypothetical protein VGO46_06635 [Gemmatimonadaceae bacterium]|nr:hypothetical protein [Gemmatimonadaceae bacterium]